MVAKYAIEHWTRIPCEVELAHEFRYRDPILTRDTLVVAISQSGETADTLMAIRHAREQRAKVLAICNTNGSTIPRESDAVIYTHAGPEIGVASTKGFLTQLVACYLLGLYLAQVRGTKYGDEIAAVVRELEQMPAARAADARRRPSRSTRWPRELRRRRSVLFLGRHAGYPVALEGALKLKELAYIHAEGFAAGELKHGPIALVEDGLPVFCVVPPQGRDQLHDKMVSGIQEVRARGARTIVLAEEGDDDGRAVRRRADPAARVPTLLQPMVAVVPLQLFACELATADGPRRRPAAQPRQVRHGRVDGVGHDHRRRHRRGATSRGSGSRSSARPALRERLFTPAEAALSAGVAGRPVRGQGGARQGAGRADRDATGTTPRSSTTRAGGPRFELRGTVPARAERAGGGERARLAVPRRRASPRRSSCWSPDVPLAADAVQAFSGQHYLLLGALRRRRRRAWCCSGRTQRDGTAAGVTRGRVLAVALRLRRGAEPGLPADARESSTPARRCRCSCATWPG